MVVDSGFKITAIFPGLQTIGFSNFNFKGEIEVNFAAGERIEMIHNSLKDSEIDLSRCFVVGIENQFNIATWASYLKAALPQFDRVYSGNDYVAMLLADSQIQVITPEFLDRGKYNATRIRSMIISDENWQDFVPKAVFEFILKINGKNRLKVISESNTKPTEY